MIGASRKRPLLQHNYHMMANNAVLPTDENPDVIHNHTKVIRDYAPRLAPTLRPGMTAELY